uniref:Uncharacterized protein n=1 Tax=Nelumbo nucifera TaxID=4432 RepID=A0A822XMZ8_NELNU|nr:TPA_asm: hypothetical protein HUJ06_022034 [Nelumbo nucifera]
MDCPFLYSVSLVEEDLCCYNLLSSDSEALKINTISAI